MHGESKKPNKLGYQHRVHAATHATVVANGCEKRLFFPGREGAFGLNDDDNDNYSVTPLSHSTFSCAALIIYKILIV